MSLGRYQICKVFEDLEHLLFDSGIYLSPSPMDGIWVQFYSDSLKVRRILSHQNGKLHGLQAIFNRSGYPAVIEHYRQGIMFGEAICAPSVSGTKTHLLYPGTGEPPIPYTLSAATNYKGYLFTNAEKDLPERLYRMFTRHMIT